MGSLFSKPPKPPSVQSQANAHEKSAQALMDREQVNVRNQYGPYGGSVTYDPTTGAQTTAVGQPGQEMAGNLQNASNQYFQTAMQGAGDSTEAWKRAFGMAREFTDPLFADQIAGQEAQLRNQGLVPGTKAYDSSMQSLRRSQGEQYNRAALGAQQQAFGQSQDQFRNSLAALAPGYQLGAPAFMDPNVSPYQRINTGGAFNAPGAMQNNYQQELADYNNRQAGFGGLLKTGLSLATAPMTGGMSLAGMGMNLLQGNPYNYGSSWAPSVTRF